VTLRKSSSFLGKLEDMLVCYLSMMRYPWFLGLRWLWRSNTPFSRGVNAYSSFGLIILSWNPLSVLWFSCLPTAISAGFCELFLIFTESPRWMTINSGANASPS